MSACVCVPVCVLRDGAWWCWWGGSAERPDSDQGAALHYCPSFIPGLCLRSQGAKRQGAWRPSQGPSHTTHRHPAWEVSSFNQIFPCFFFLICLFLGSHDKAVFQGAPGSEQKPRNDRFGPRPPTGAGHRAVSVHLLRTVGTVEQAPHPCQVLSDSPGNPGKLSCPMAWKTNIFWN